MYFRGFPCYFGVYFVSFVNIRVVAPAEVKISDACHGPRWVNKANNILTCAEGQQVKITRVLMYQAQNNDLQCPATLSNDDPPNRCCNHDDTRCRWDGKDENNVAAVQAQCEGQRQCHLQSSTAERVVRRCHAHISLTSNIRSIRYTCIIKPGTSLTSPPTPLPITPAVSLRTSRRPTQRLTLPISPAASSTIPTTQSLIFTSGKSESNSTPLTTARLRSTAPTEILATPSTTQASAATAASTEQPDSTTAKGNNSVEQTSDSERISPDTSSSDTSHYVSDQPNSRISVGVIVGAALGGLAMICITIIVIVVLIKRSGRAAEKQPITNNEVNRGSVANPGYFDVVYSEAAALPDIYSEDKYSQDESNAHGEFEMYSTVYENEGDYAELSDFTQPPDRNTSQEYNHVVGESPASFPASQVADYDNVTSDSADQDSNYASGNETDTFHYFQVKGTYDSLDGRKDFHSPPEKKEVEDSYNTLGRTVINTPGTSNLSQ